MSRFDDLLFPIEWSARATRALMRPVEIVALPNGAEERNLRQRAARREFSIGPMSIDSEAAETLMAFFQARGGAFAGFRFRDPFDWKSCSIAAAPAASDQRLGIGDGGTKSFRLQKVSADGQRFITRPVVGSVSVMVGGAIVSSATYTVNTTTGALVFSSAPAAGAEVRAGFRFDVPVRFAIDRLVVERLDEGLARVDTVKVVEILE